MTAPAPHAGTRRPGHPPEPAPPRFTLGRLLAWLSVPPLLAAALLLGGVAAVWQALHSEAGTRWLLEHAAPWLPGVAFEGARGALLGRDSHFALARLVVRTPAGATLRIDEPRVEGLELFDWRPSAPFVQLQARGLAARRIAWLPGPPQPDDPPRALPAHLRLPVGVRIDRVAVERLLLGDAAFPVEGLQARVELGRIHRVETLALRWRGLQLEGAAQLDADAPFELRARADVRGDPLAAAPSVPAWAQAFTLGVQAQGPLAGFDGQATLAMRGQRLDARGRVTPFAPLPVSQLDLRFAALDLAQLLAPLGPQGSVPATELHGSARLQLERGAPLAVVLEARNAQPGRWDQRRLPIAALELRAQGEGSAWRIEHARVALASDARSPAGVVSGSGAFDGLAGSLRVALDQLRPAGLDRRAPPLQLSGPVILRHEPAPGTGTALTLGTLDFNAQLAGHLLGPARARAPQPLRAAAQLALRGSARPGAVRIERLRAQAGKARLDGSVHLLRSGAAAWDVETDLQLAQFDPALWLPGEPGAAWRTQRNLLNGTIAAQLRLPERPAAGAAVLRTLRGTLALDLSDSLLAGQPVALALNAEADGKGQLDARGSAEAGGNRATLALRLRAPGSGSAGDERLQVELDAPSLARLAPLAEAVGAGPLAGQVRLETSAEGPAGTLGAWLAGDAAREPLATRGSLRLAALQAGALQLETATARWDATLPAAAGTAPAAALREAAVQSQGELSGLRLPAVTVQSAALQLDGRLADHRATLTARLLQPRPAGTPATQELPQALALSAALQGGWQAGAPNRWELRLSELALRPSDGGDGARRAAPLPLLVARDVRIAVSHGTAGLRAEAEPGTAEVLGATLRWSRLHWASEAGAPPQLGLQATIDPVAVAPLLARLQPDFGWSGDLRVGARITARSDPAFELQLEVARTGGDLQVSEFGVTQTLGLTDLRFTLDADRGRWRASQLVVGRELGRVAGRQSLVTDAERLWPAPQAALDGALELQVENLAGWGAWVPAGWRLGGRIDAALQLAGRFGAPELIGELRGRDLALRNALEGVALADGSLDARFDGASARLEALRFRAGDGTLRLSGDARLGAAPSAELRLLAERATLLGRVDRRVVASGDARIELEAQRIAIDGEVRVDEGLIDISRSDAPSLGDDVTVRRGDGRGGTPEDVRRGGGSALEAVDLRLLVNLGQRLRLRGRGIDTRLAGELLLTSPKGKLLARGEIRAVDGSYEAYGQQLDIERGVITFVGDIANPRLDIEAVRANTDTRVGVLVSGSATAPRVRLFSDPELPDTEKLALLVTGRRYDSLGGSDTLLLQRAALALLAGDGSDGRNFDVAGMLQLDELSVRQSDGAVRDTFVTLGKQISERVYLGYERGLSAAAGNWQLIYRIAQRFTLRAQSGLDPAIDLIWLFRWN